MKKTTAWGLAAVASAWCIGADFPSYLKGDWGVTASIATGVAFAVAGAVAVTRQPDNRTGALLLLTAFVWPFGSLPKWEDPLLAQIGIAGGWLWIVSLAYLVLAFPAGRLERKKDVVTCWVASLPGFWVVIMQLPFMRFTDPFEIKELIPSTSKPITEALDLVSMTTALVCVGMIIGRVREKWQRATPAGKRVLAPVVVTGAGALTATATIVLTILYLPGVDTTSSVLPRINWLIVATVPVGFLLGLSRARARRARVGELVVELGDLPSPERLQDALRKALGDPTLVAAFWVPDAQRYLTPEGLPIELPAEDSSSVATFLERNEEPLAVIVHDRYLMEDPALIASATAATRLAVENERLQQEVVDQLMEVRASRSRIVKAGDEARKRLERDLHDGAQQRLVTLGLKLQRLESKLGPLDDDTGSAMQEARHELKAALTELRDLARGLHPLVLTEEGLVTALEGLCARFPLPVRLETAHVGRFLEPIETATYFMVSEALANIAKHSQATEAIVRLATIGDEVEVTIIDNGIGGALITSGGGLRGLVDRIQALDGSVSISSPPGLGTTLTATLPRTLPELDPLAPPERERPLIATKRQGSAPDLPLLRVRNLDVFHGHQQVLDGIDLDVATAETVAVLGTNGAGKSTLARTLAGLHEHARGSIRLAGNELTDLTPDQRSRSGLVFIEGGAGIFQPLTVDENLRLFARHAGVSQAEGIERAVDSFPFLTDKRSQRAGSLSRGEQHMLALSRALMCEASMVIIDELSLGLSGEAIEDVYAHLRTLNAQGRAILFVEQSATDAARLASRSYFLDGGRVAFEGSIPELQASGLLVPTWMKKEHLAHV